MNVNNQMQSRWGFHPCTYETYQKLKFLKKHYWIAIREFHVWHRWWRKEPQSRRGVEPSYCKVFVEDRVWFKFLTRKGERHVKIYPRTVIGFQFCQLFDEARKPNSEPVDRFDVETLAKIGSMYERVRKYLNVDKQNRRE